MIERHATDVARLTDVVGSRLDGSPLAILLDIDGTLAPIAPRPQDAAVPPETRDVLRRLVALPGVCLALVTGRSAIDARRMAVDGVWIIGNHGLELLPPGGNVSPSDEALPYENAVQSAARDLVPLEREIPGVIIENKRWSLSLHYRLVSADAVPGVIARAREVASAHALRVTDGKKIVELRPPVLIDKGTAAVAFVERVGALREGASVLYAGDDQTDEDAFRALRDPSLRTNAATATNAVTVRIRSPEDEPGGMTRAEFRLASPDELRQAMEWLVARRASAADGSRR
jgi:trehalose-phosphatase